MLNLEAVGKAHPRATAFHAARRLGISAVWAALVCGVLASSAWAAEGETPADPDQLLPIEVGQPTRIEVHPQSFKLTSPRRTMRLVVTGHYANGHVQDLTRVATFRSADEKVLRLEGGIAHPAGNGKTAVLVEVGGQQASVPAEVTGFEQPEPISFAFETLVALSKHDCNSGACHGSPSGKGGFRLSLRAYDPVLDEETLIREAFNRRTNVLEPEQSLLLRKPVMELAHGGGRRMRKTDVAYKMLRDWISQGLKTDPADTPQCVKVEVYPTERTLHFPAHTQQLSVLAHFSDGSVRDVSDLALYASSDDNVASVDTTGFVFAHDRGEAVIVVRYLDKVETAHMTFLKEVPGFHWPSPPEVNYVDQAVFAKLQRMQIVPSDLCTDEEFIRRVYLDVIGILPTPTEVRNFLADQSPNKRSTLIDQLLERPEYADFWALKWGDLLRANNKQVSASGVHKFRRWIVASIRDNKPYDKFVEELLSAEGSTFDNPPANYFRTAADMEDCAETTAQIFLGIRIQCAKCHNHPFERWTQDNYYGIGAFFNRVKRKPSPQPDEMVIWVARDGEVTQPRTGELMKPWLPLTGSVDLPGEEDRREAFIEWMRRKDNPLFAHAAVNRLWGHLFGRGIVEPVDDFRASNPPSNAELLDALAQDFIESGFDQKHIIRTILNSRTYQLSSKKNEFNAQDEKYFSHAGTRMLSAEQLLDAICHVTGVPEKFTGLPAGTRAIQLPSPDVDHQFLKVFGQPAREMACQCERSSESNLSQALQMINGPLVHDKLRAENNHIRKAVAEGKSNREIIENLYMLAMCRQPSEPELERALAHVESQEDRVAGLEDVCWALLNAKEFLFQH